MQAQTTGRLHELRLHRYIFGAIAGIGIAAAIIFGVQTLTD